MWWVAHAPAQGRGKGGVASTACRYGRVVSVHQGETSLAVAVEKAEEWGIFKWY